MKLQFSSRDEISLLVVTGPVTIHDTSILKAGITKILGSDLRKVVLCMGLSELAGEEVLRELAQIEQLARNQGGAIAFGGLGPDLKRVVEKVSPAMAAMVFASDDDAINHLKGAPQAAPMSEVDVLRGKLAEKEKELAAFKARYAAGDSEETLKMRVQVADLVAKNRYLEEQLRLMTLDRRLPPDADAVAEKIASLEAAVEALRVSAGS